MYLLTIMNQITNNKASSGLIISYFAYSLTLSAFFVSSFFPELRLWGINHWAYLPEIWRYILFGLGLLILISVILLNNREENFEKKLNSLTDKTYYIFSAILIVGLTACFILFRVKTYFLGDGYTIFSQLASDNPFIKQREIGEALIHIWVKNMFGTGKEAALLSFQSISIISGLLLIITSAYFSKLLFKKNIERIIFLSGVCTGGYMLLYFGYVEYYSIFVLSVLLYSFIGLLIAKEKLNRWFILPALFFSIFLHIMGVTLIPSAIYLFFSNSKTANFISKFKASTKYLSGTVLIILLSAVFYYFYSHYYFFRFSLVPLVADRFTIEGYTMFSDNHIIDFINLLFILIPSLLILTATIYTKDINKIFKHTSIRFLILMILSTSGAAFIFDPKLGMPRDWDLFSFAGIPIVIFLFFVPFILKNKRNKITILLVSLNCLILIPKIKCQNEPENSIKQVNQYINFDKKKNRPTIASIKNYYDKLGDKNSSKKYQAKWINEYPEMQLLENALSLKNSGKFHQSISLYHNVIKINPIIGGSYLHIGDCYIYLKNYDSALFYLKIADGMNPNNPTTLHNFATIYLNIGKIKKAEETWLKAINIDDTTAIYLFGLSSLYKQKKDYENWFIYLDKASKLNNCPYYVFSELGEYYLLKKDYRKAATNFESALIRGLDKRYMNSVFKDSPLLKPYFEE